METEELKQPQPEAELRHGVDAQEEPALCSLALNAEATLIVYQSLKLFAKTLIDKDPNSLTTAGKTIGIMESLGPAAIEAARQLSKAAPNGEQP